LQSALRKRVFLCAPLAVQRERPTRCLFVQSLKAGAVECSPRSTRRRQGPRSQGHVEGPNGARRGLWGEATSRAAETHLEGEGPPRPSRAIA